MSIALSVLIIISSLAVIVSVTLQEGKDRGDATFMPPEPIWGANKGTGREFTLKRITIVSMLIFVSSILGLLIISK